MALPITISNVGADNQRRSDAAQGTEALDRQLTMSRSRPRGVKGGGDQLEIRSAR